MNRIRAILAACTLQLKSRSSVNVVAINLLAAVPSTAVIAWIAAQSDDPGLITYLTVAAPLVGIWAVVIYRIGWTLSGELSGQTLPFILISRTSLVPIAMGKMLAELILGLPFGIVSTGVMLLVTRQLPQISSIGLLIPSMMTVIIGLTAIGLVFAPLMVLFRGRPGFFNAVIPLGILLGGFRLPIDQLPTALQVMSRFFPMAWGMDSVWLSIQGFSSWPVMIRGWLMALVLSAVLLAFTGLLSRYVERRVRIDGTLGIFT